MAILNERGHEILDETPFAVNLPFVRHDEPLHLRIRRMVMETLRQQQSPESESFEDANDFDCEGVIWQDTEIEDLPTPYEEVYIANMSAQAATQPAVQQPEAQPEPAAAPAQTEASTPS